MRAHKHSLHRDPKIYLAVHEQHLKLPSIEFTQKCIEICTVRVERIFQNHHYFVKL